MNAIYTVFYKTPYNPNRTYYANSNRAMHFNVFRTLDEVKAFVESIANDPNKELHDIYNNRTGKRVTL